MFLILGPLMLLAVPSQNLCCHFEPDLSSIYDLLRNRLMLGKLMPPVGCGLLPC